jgi:LysM repeat protein
MARKILISILLCAIFAVLPVTIFAGGVCGGTYIVEKGETFSSIAAKCGTTVSIIMSANPGVSEPLKTGQAITVPGLTSTSHSGPITDNTSSNNNSSNYGPVNYTNIYIVQVGDTFSSIAARYGVSVSTLWAANPYIWDINYIFVGQSIYVPASSSTPGGVISTLPPEPDHLSYGTVPANAPKGKITLSNKANGDVYVSLQGTRADGTHVINEYSVNGQRVVKVPAGSYTYVASVGGVKFVGQFHLGGGGELNITFFANKVLVE